MALLSLMTALGFLNDSQAGHNSIINKLVMGLDETPHSHKMENDWRRPQRDLCRLYQTDRNSQTHFIHNP